VRAVEHLAVERDRSRGRARGERGNHPARVRELLLRCRDPLGEILYTEVRGRLLL
jgi:hypothetical protein